MVWALAQQPRPGGGLQTDDLHAVLFALAVLADNDGRATVLRDSLLRIVAAVGMDAHQADAALTVLTGRRLIRPLVGRQTWQLLGER